MRPAGVSLVVFEDSLWRKLRPVTDTVVVPALRIGDTTMTGRWMEATGLPLAGIAARPTALSCWHDAPPAEEPSDEVLLVNAAALPGTWHQAAVEGGPARWVQGGRTLLARASWDDVRGALATGPEKLQAALAALPERRLPDEVRVLDHPWSPIHWNSEILKLDLARGPFDHSGIVDARATLIEPDRIRIDPGARVDPGAVLDAREGPIRLGPGVIVMPHTLVLGPCSVGAGAQLLGGVVSRSSIGPQCRIAGEVEECVWQGWSNKRHHGFVGHSWIGEWVNLGALTTTSDLKNNYGTVRVHEDGVEVESGETKIGSIVGAHVKTGIGTLLPTGAVIGVGANVFGGGRFAPKHVAAFSWWDGVTTVEHRFDRFVETARIAMSRRDRAFGPAEEAQARAVFEETATERAPRKAAATREKSISSRG